jgi:hypothetical protein
MNNMLEGLALLATIYPQWVQLRATIALYFGV